MLVHNTLTISGMFLPSSLFTKQLHTEGQDKFVARPHLTPTVSRLQWLLKSWNYQFYNVLEGFLSLRSRSQKLINKTPGIILFPHWGKYWHHHPGPQGSLIVPRTKKADTVKQVTKVAISSHRDQEGCRCPCSLSRREAVKVMIRKETHLTSSLFPSPPVHVWASRRNKFSLDAPTN